MKVAKKAINWAWLDGIPYSTLRTAFAISTMEKKFKNDVNFRQPEIGLGSLIVYLRSKLRPSLRMRPIKKKTCKIKTKLIIIIIILIRQINEI